MKFLKSISIFSFIALAVLLSACGAESSGENSEEVEETVMTTEAFIADAKTLSYEEFEKKYPRESEITLEGEVRAPATWDDKIVAKFGTGLNDLPLSADFMFADNGGSLESTKEKVKGGELVRFTGTIDGSFYSDANFQRCSFKNCVAK